MTGSAGGVRAGGLVALPAQLAGVAPGKILPATVLVLPGRQQYLLQVAGRELPWPTKQVVAAGERVAVLVGNDPLPAGAGPGVALSARVFRLAAADRLLAELKLPQEESYHAALRDLLERGRPFTAARLRAAGQVTAGGSTTAAAAPPTGADTPVAELLARGKMPDQPLIREIVDLLKREGRNPAMAQVWNVMARALQAEITGGAELARLAAAPGSGQAPVTVATLLAQWRLPDDALHRGLLQLLLAGGRLPTAETVRNLAARAEQWGAADMAGWRALVRQWERDLPPVKEIWLRLRAALLAPDRPLAALAALAQQTGWSAPPGDFNPGYWSRLGLTTEASLAGETQVSGDNLRSIMLHSDGASPAAEAAGAWLEGCALEAATNPDGEVVLPLLFTGAAGPLTGTLTVRDRPGSARRAGKSRPGLSLALDFTALGAVRVDANPAGQGYELVVRGADPVVAEFLAAAGDGLRAAVAACGGFSVRFAGPRPEGGAASGVDVRA